MSRMKRLQISLEPELDQQLERTARKSGVSKAEVVRRSLRESIDPPARLADDPLFQLRSPSGQGRKSGETVDDLLYGPVRAR